MFATYAAILEFREPPVGRLRKSDYGRGCTVSTTDILVIVLTRPRLRRSCPPYTRLHRAGIRVATSIERFTSVFRQQHEIDRAARSSRPIDRSVSEIIRATTTAQTELLIFVSDSCACNFAILSDFHRDSSSGERQFIRRLYCSFDGSFVRVKLRVASTLHPLRSHVSCRYNIYDTQDYGEMDVRKKCLMRVTSGKLIAALISRKIVSQHKGLEG